MATPFRDYRMDGSIWGYGVETGTHAVRLMLSGVLDRFPRVRIVLGHMGEALPFWLWRLDFMAAPGSRAALRNQLKPSEYTQRNFAITTSGVEDPLVLRFCIDKVGLDRVMWAVDYPYQPTAPAVAFLELLRSCPARIGFSMSGGSVVCIESEQKPKGTALFPKPIRNDVRARLGL